MVREIFYEDFESGSKKGIDIQISAPGIGTKTIDAGNSKSNVINQSGDKVLKVETDTDYYRQEMVLARGNDWDPNGTYTFEESIYLENIDNGGWTILYQHVYNPRRGGDFSNDLLVSYNGDPDANFAPAHEITLGSSGGLDFKVFHIDQGRPNAAGKPNATHTSVDIIGKAPIREWFDIKIEYKLGSNGWVKTYFNGELQDTYNGPVGLPQGAYSNEGYIKAGVYQPRKGGAERDVLIDDVALYEGIADGSRSGGNSGGRQDPTPTPTPDLIPDPTPEPTPDPEPNADDFDAEFLLIDADHDVVIQTLEDGDAIDLALVDGVDWSIVAKPNDDLGSVSESATFEFDDYTRTESGQPYALFGDPAKDTYNGAVEKGEFDYLKAGDYSFDVEFFREDAGEGGGVFSESVDFTVVDNSPRPDPEPPAPNPTPQPPEAPSSDASEVVYRINAGGAKVEASDGGPDWAADNGKTKGTFIAGFGKVTGGEDLSDDVPDELFKTERWGSEKDSLSYDLAVDNGDYEVRLFFGDGYEGTSQAGQREFDVVLEGETELDDFDPTATFGWREGGVVAVETSVTDGELNIDFEHGVQNPMINGIEVVRVGEVFSTSAVSPSASDQSVLEDDRQQEDLLDQLLLDVTAGEALGQIMNGLEATMAGTLASTSSPGEAIAASSISDDAIAPEALLTLQTANPQVYDNQSGEIVGSDSPEQDFRYDVVVQDGL